MLPDGSIRVEMPRRVQEARASLEGARQIIVGAMLQCQFPDQHESACVRLDKACDALIDAMSKLREGGAA
jgi:hypothetical protein